MIVSIDIKTIFEHGDTLGELLNYARPMIQTFKSFGYKIAVFAPEVDENELELRLNREMIPFDSINKLPNNSNESVSFEGVIRFEHNGNYFDWSEVREGLRDILLIEYDSFYEMYRRNAMNEPSLRQGIIDEIIEE